MRGVMVVPVMMILGAVLASGEGIQPPGPDCDWSLHAPEEGNPPVCVLAPRGGGFKVHNNGPATVIVQSYHKDENGFVYVDNTPLGANCSTMIHGAEGWPVSVFFEEEHPKPCTRSTGTFN